PPRAPSLARLSSPIPRPYPPASVRPREEAPVEARLPDRARRSRSARRCRAAPAPLSLAGSLARRARLSSGARRGTPSWRSRLRSRRRRTRPALSCAPVRHARLRPPKIAEDLHAFVERGCTRQVLRVDEDALALRVLREDRVAVGRLVV